MWERGWVVECVNDGELLSSRRWKAKGMRVTKKYGQGSLFISVSECATKRKGVSLFFPKNKISEVKK